MLESLLWAAIVTLFVSPALLLLRDHGKVDVLPDGLPRNGPRLSSAPCLHVVPQDAAEFVIPDFRPGMDRCHVALSDPDADFDAVLGDDGVRFQFLDGDSFLEVVFPGLVDPPFEDTRIFGPGPAATGRLLSDLVGGVSTSPAAFHRVQSQVAAFQTFNATDEVVEVWVPPDIAAIPEIDVRPSPDGAHGEVMIDGQPVARLCGAPEAGLANIRIVRKLPDPLDARHKMSA